MFMFNNYTLVARFVQCTYFLHFSINLLRNINLNNHIIKNILATVFKYMYRLKETLVKANTLKIKNKLYTVNKKSIFEHNRIDVA